MEYPVYDCLKLFDILLFLIFCSLIFFTQTQVFRRKSSILSIVLLYALSLSLTLIQLSSPWFNLREHVVNNAIFLFKSFQRFPITYRIKLTLVILVELIFSPDQRKSQSAPQVDWSLNSHARRKLLVSFSWLFPASISKVSKNLRNKVRGHASY